MRTWLRNFLIDRKLCWGPQGSVLGPLLFLVYVNDLPGKLCSPSLMYADDIKVWRTIKDPNDRSYLQADLNNQAQWADTWALPVNTAKLHGTSYEGRLQATSLFPITYRRLEGDLICLRKIMRGDMGPELQQYFPLPTKHLMRGYSLTLRKLQSIGLPLVYRHLRMSTRLWNSLPAIVVEEKTDAAFKRRLDEHLKGLWRKEHLRSDPRLSGDGAYTGTLPSALNNEDYRPM
ncbi:unnamed protein product [Echinostoma caproni]|uniref:Reverse transcriptase domain-containing protein n=1 Tax=Echinostoma caproni TaxID=27848 RepID=A0A183AC69_9TREM|nr:unnamed protein product [Echinostoma caproni]